MAAACSRANYGLTSAHAYALIDVVQLGSTKLVKVYNPWGKEEYDGPWNDKDRRWTSSYKARVNLDATDNGAVWMPLDVFRASFDGYHVNAYNDNW